MKVVLTWNAGSSSLKVSAFAWPSLRELGQISIDRFGLPHPTVEYRFGQFIGHEEFAKIKTWDQAVTIVSDILAAQDITIEDVRTSLHRFVLGGRYRTSVKLTSSILRHLQSVKGRAPLHLPAELAVVRAVLRHKLGHRQIACFDTSFFSLLPKVATTYALDHRLAQKFDLHRLGYHGLSHASAVREAARILKLPAKKFSGITVHLGSGCSVTAIRNGQAVDTSMGLTALEGLVMGTRPGDLDAGIILELLRRGMTTKQVSDLLERKSGLLGVSGYSSDLRDILSAAGYPVARYRPRLRPTASQRARSRLALNVFVYRCQKYLGAYAAILDRVDAVVFTGAAGERNAALRQLIVSGIRLRARPKVLAVPADEAGEMLHQAKSQL